MAENLYNSLGYNASTDDLTDVEKTFIIEQIPLLNEEKKKLVWKLILCDHMKTNPKSKVIFPYKTKQIDDDIEIKIDALPVTLQRVLHKFCTFETQNSQQDVTPLVGF